MNSLKKLEAEGRAALRVTPLEHLRAISAQLHREGRRTDSESILTHVQQAEAEHAALVAVAEAAKAAQAMARARGLHFDGLDTALANLNAVCQQNGGGK